MGCDDIVALFAYDELGARMVEAFKFHNDRSCLRWAATQLAQAVGQSRSGLLVTWAPTTSRRRRERGYDQAEKLARLMACVLDVRCRGLLRRVGDVSQTGRDVTERRTSPPEFLASGHTGVHDVLIVDDVCTTGATLSAAALALKAAGADGIRAAVLAYTPKRV